MTLVWSEPQPAGFWDGYLDWSHLVHERRRALAPPDRTERHWFEPIFVRLHAPLPENRAALRALIDDASQPFVMDPHEYARLAARIDGAAPFAALPDDYALYRRLGTANGAEGGLWTVMDVGSPVDLDPQTTPVPTSWPLGPAHTGHPIVAIVDDGIAFLNRRFRAGAHTRFHAVWLQSDEKSRISPGGARRAWTGEILRREDIDRFLAQGSALDEPSVYARLNARLFEAGAHRSTEFARSHGTHILDLAAGADPDDATDPARSWPLLAVQLPPEAIEDTSGTRFESYMVQAVRWCLAEAHEIDPSQPVIVNLSLGMLAGPKDGTRFAEYQIAQEAIAWERATGQPVRIVLSFGNGHRTRQVARMDLTGTDPASILWRAQPGDLTASYMELNAEDAESDAFDVALAPPGGGPDFARIPEGAMRTLSIGADAVARIYHVPRRSYPDGTVARGRYMLALAPTEGLKAAEPAAPPGGWRVWLRRHAPGTSRVHLQIQRGETLPGYVARGRQSYFDDPSAYAKDAETRDTRGLDPEGPLRRAGSHSALVTAPAPQVISVGAAMLSPETGAPAPARYTAEGAAWSVPGPAVSAIADEGAALLGVIACGTLSESAAHLDGTSAAAGRITRALASSASQLIPGGGLPDMAADVPRSGPADASRLGPVTLSSSAGARRRRDPV